jgi:hypothetical protein
MTLYSSPRCVIDFVVSPTDQPRAELGSLDGQNYFLSLSCPCSCRSFAVHSIFAPHFYLKHAVAYGPIMLRCVTCARERICFDPAQHGLDAELDHSQNSNEYTGEFRDFACLGCEATSFQVTARFEYPPTARLGQPTESSDPADEDLFTYFMLIGTCHSCGRITPISDVQCA